jgi:hypothetical protein
MGRDIRQSEAERGRDTVALLAHELTCPPALFRTLYRDSHRSQAAAFGFDDALTRRRGAGCCRATGENARRGDGADCQRKDDPAHLSTSLPSGRFDRTWTPSCPHPTAQHDRTPLVGTEDSSTTDPRPRTLASRGSAWRERPIGMLALVDAGSGGYLIHGAARWQPS